jgi:hypothetical protein
MGERHKLIHFGVDHLRSVRSEKQGERRGGAYKPNGLWISVEGGKSFGWRAWCEGERYDNLETKKQTQVVLAKNHGVLWLRTVSEMDAFTEAWSDGGYANEPRWSEIASRWRGIIIAPYQWSRRLARNTGWYYSWDCASGCIWDAKAIADLKPIRIAELESAHA